ncbi:MAG: family 10 glycosylhydrolase [Gloeocapsa sp. UFS-A4-WI-NPMV-4B04]|jgi:uncharacterized lipoprotein YddW (UPF0748 family)|nr:family 10 glycosylhydrolase [Gloeocapsa sp. UFS-A4-WI-NPMV-4B04]
MAIKFRFSVPTPLQAKSKSERRKNPFFYLLSVASCLLPLASYFVLVPAALAEEAVFGVVKSDENANQWQGITTRLQAAGVAYCVVDLPSVRSTADLGDRTVLFLPNIETITPGQAIALEGWMSRGGRVIASGPVGNMSQPGVRQLLRSLLGAYWGFNLTTPSNLQPLRTKTQEWVRQNGLSGTIQGGVIIPASLTSKPAAVWQSKDSPPAVVTTDRSTVLGWNWGVNTAAPAALDSAWLRAALGRYIQLSPTATSPSSAKNCPGTVVATAKAPTPKPTTPPRNAAINQAPPTRQVAVAPRQIAPSVRPQADEPLERLAPRGLEVAPTVKQPINNVEAIALRQELDNLIGRFESAQLAANSTNSSGTRRSQRPSATNAVAEARAIAKALPQLIKRQDYATARQQWQKAQQLLWNNYPSDHKLAQPEIRAMWLDRGSIVRAGSEQGLAKIFDRLAAAGINTVFFETVNAGYPIYPSQVAPQQNPLVRGWDPLAAGVKLAHERGIELHAWVWAFAVGNQRHNTLVNLPTNYPGPVITAHPDWASYDNRGSLFPPGQGKPFLDPANPEARRYLLQLFDEIVSRYQVDGLQLDYIRYPFQDPGAGRTYGYGMAARQQFQQLTGADPTQIRPSARVLWQKWTQFRTGQIDSFVAIASERLRQKRPNLIMSVAVFPLSEHERIHKLQQHWEVWANRGDVNLIVPMTYATDTYRFQLLTQPWLTSTKLGSALILPGIRLLNLPVSVAVDQIQLARDLPVSGYSLFAVENLSNELQSLFQRTQGSTTSRPQGPIPYRQPFETAAARYTTLQQEWNFLLGNNQLWLRGSALSSWRTQSKALETALNQLSADPSPRRLAVARASLTTYQSQFYDWMRLQALENPYQVKVWLNRLASVEKLLSYGERVVLKKESPAIAEQP